MACKPGDIVQLTCSGEDICTAVSQVASHSGRLVDHENRITENEADINRNRDDIVDLKLTNLEPRVLQNEQDIHELDGEVTTLGSNLSVLSSRVDVNESDIETINNDISGLPTLYAALSGNENQQFNVADPTLPTHAVSLQYADANYPNANNFYTKIESDALYLGIQDKAYDSDMLGSIKYDKYVQVTMVATKDDPGIVRQATDSEAIAGLVDDVFMSPKQVADAIAAAP